MSKTKNIIMVLLKCSNRNAFTKKKFYSSSVTITFSSDFHRISVCAPCTDKVCENGGKCITDLTSNPATGSCVCPIGFDGENCKTGKVIKLFYIQNDNKSIVLCDKSCTNSDIICFL